VPGWYASRGAYVLLFLKSPGGEYSSTCGNLKQGRARDCAPIARQRPRGSEGNPRASSTAVVSDWLRLVHKVRLKIQKPPLYGGKITSIRVVHQNNECELGLVPLKNWSGPEH